MRIERVEDPLPDGSYTRSLRIVTKHMPRRDYLKLVGESPNDDALGYVLGALGRNLKAAREHAGLTQQALAKKLKKAQATVSGSENGKIQVSEKYVAKVLKVCGLPPDWKA